MSTVRFAIGIETPAALFVVCITRANEGLKIARKRKRGTIISVNSEQVGCNSSCSPSCLSLISGPGVRWATCQYQSRNRPFLAHGSVIQFRNRYKCLQSVVTEIGDGRKNVGPCRPPRRVGHLLRRQNQSTSRSGILHLSNGSSTRRKACQDIVPLSGYWSKVQ